MMIKDVRELITLARELGARELKVGGFHVVLQAPPPELVEIDPKVFADPLQTPASEDEVLFWSAGGSGVKDTQGNDVPAPLVGEDG